MVKKKRERNSRTHFEQIPVEIVKGIAKADVSKDEKTKREQAAVEPVSRKSIPNRVPARPRNGKRR
jgi:hypothetical protein